MDFAAALPDPGEPDFPAVLAVGGLFVGAAKARLGGASWDEAERESFKYGFYMTGWGVAAYLFGLISGLY